MGAHARTTHVPEHRDDADTGAIVIKDIRGMDGITAVENLQIAVWGGDASWVVPSHLLYVVAETGGILLGAYAEGRLVGFVFGLLGRRHGQVYHASHMLGIDPANQQHGIGAALKWRQRDRAIEQGLELMTWTFDPLESRNAYFNLHKLGATAGTYKVDYYGSMSDELNRGLPSDRLVIEWFLGEEPGARRTSGDPESILTEEAGLPESRLDESLLGRPLAIHVPRTIQTLKRERPDIALAWRLSVRDAFAWAFDHGYAATDFRDGAYVLSPSGGTSQ